jgi:2-polyprenyl-3-methyl-5-hydroxy-6-metoxy-1,4-benzoquinol methylase
MNQQEKTRLENISRNSLYAAGVGTAMVEYTFRIVQRHLTGTTVLEVGPAEGVMTGHLVKTGKRMTVVEGSATFCASLRERFPDAKIVNALFEEFEPEGTYDNIILGHVLEHVEDPVACLRKVARCLTLKTGKVFASVPNARSIHRQAAVIMKLLPTEDTLNELDIHHGHRRVFNPETFRNVFYQAGLNIEVFGGYWLKPVSNRQIDESWTPQMIEAFMQVGERYPDIAAEIYALAATT